MDLIFYLFFKYMLKEGTAILSSIDELIKEVKIGGNLNCSDHTLVKFVISRNMSLAKSKVRTLDFQRAIFKPFKDLADEIP